MKFFKILMQRLASIVPLCLIGLVLADTPATITQPTDLLKKPQANSAVVTKLKKSQSVSVTTREGGWYQVMVEGNVGWIKMFFLRFNPESRSESRSGVGALLSSTRKPHSEVALTTGVRGINEKMLKNAKPDFVGLNTMSQFRSDANSVKRFAQEGKLKSRKVKYIERKE